MLRRGLAGSALPIDRRTEAFETFRHMTPLLAAGLRLDASTWIGPVESIAINEANMGQRCFEQVLSLARKKKREVGRCFGLPSADRLSSQFNRS